LRLPRGTREAGLAVAAAALMLSGLGALDDTAVLRGLETASLDLRFRVRGVRAPGPEVVLVMIDDRSLAALGRWPLSRRTITRAIEALRHAGARAAVFDLLFAEPEQPVPPDVRAAARAAAAGLGADAPLRGALDRLADDDPDRELAAALRAAGSVLLPIAFAFEGLARAAPDYLADFAYARFDNSALTPEFPLTPVSAVLPIEPLARAAAGLGVATIVFDRDGAPRYDYLAWRFEGDIFPSLPVRAVAAYRGLPWDQVALALGAGVRLGDRFVATNPAMRMLINYRGPRGTFAALSFLDLVEGRVPPEALRGRLVLIGASVLGLSDSYGAPFDNTPMPGTERLANAVDTIVQGDFIAEISPGQTLAMAALVLLLALAVGVASALVPTRTAALVAVVPLALWCAAAQLAFVRGLWLPAVTPLGALMAASATVLLFRYWIIDRDGRRVRSAFRHYLAPDLVAALAAHPERLRLGGETRTMTMLFCDVRGFTTISEGFKADPQALTRLINRFLTPMTDIILARRGTIDKYMGDCIMAFWNAPLDDAEHADHACASALAMIAGLEALNQGLERDAAATGRTFVPLRIGIGLNTGDCVVGNMGSEQRFDYSVLGDAVNLASRLEGQSKTYGVDVVIGEATRAAAPSWATLELDRIAVKGKAEAVHIYTLLGDAETARTPEFAALAARHAAMLAAYRGRDWACAQAAADDCASQAPQLGALYALYGERIAAYRAEPPGRDWDGVFVAKEK
jgi:adenylate cyclase